MPAAIVVGGPPSFFYVAGAKLPYNVDELAVAGAFAGEPVEMVKCKTIDLEVPANAEIVVEGLVSTEEVMPGNAFAEYTGYMATEVEYRPVFHVTAVTSRASPYFVHIMSQFPPSESSKIRQISSENVYLKFLRDDCKIPGILDVVWNEISQAQWCVIKVKKINNAQPWQALYCAAGFEPLYGKYFITVDEDIDPRDSDAVTWALGWRVQPVRDMKTISGRFPGLDVSAYKCDASEEEKRYPGGVGSSALLIDATIKHPYPPLSLPSSEHMNNALKIWKELGLSELNLRQPWFGYSLGFWPEHYKKDAELVTRGEHYQVGKRLSEGAKSG
jgi:4-hydroxy-3-polyprenylbenzoate decarboxylase